MEYIQHYSNYSDCQHKTRKNLEVGATALMTKPLLKICLLLKCVTLMSNLLTHCSGGTQHWLSLAGWKIENFGIEGIGALGKWHSYTVKLQTVLLHIKSGCSIYYFAAVFLLSFPNHIYRYGFLFCCVQIKTCDRKI